MKTMLALTAAALLLSAGSAFAADPPQAAQDSPFDWSGFYVGGQAGIVVFRGDYDVSLVGPETTTGTGGSIGVYAGGTKQTASAVLGAEVGANIDIAHSTYVSGGPGTLTTSEDWDLYLKGKLGVPVSNGLLYASLGVSAARFTQSTPFGGGITVSNIVPGLSVGVGGEMPIGNNNTIRGQVEYTRYMTQRFTYIAPALFIDSTYSTVKATVGLTHYLN